MLSHSNQSDGIAVIMTKSVEDLQARKAKLERALDVLECRISVSHITPELKEGAEVYFPFGRGATKRNLSGKVIGTKVSEKGVLYVAVLTDGGFDAELVRIPALSITRVVTTHKDIEITP